MGCDGIRSRVRQILLGEYTPAAHASYTNRFCFRALVPMDKATEAIGQARSATRYMYNGPDAHIITYPVAFGASLNVLTVISDPQPWTTADGRHTATGRKAEAEAAFADWCPTVRAIVDLLPDELDKWAVFDHFEHPAPTYAKGRVCIAGDAAHAAGPHLGSGAGFGLEDALVLATLLAAAQTESKGQGQGKAGPQGKSAIVGAALAVYSDVRLERTQWLVGSTRDAVDLFQWRYPDVGNDWDKFATEITWRFHRIWNVDMDEMVREAREKFEANPQRV